jgi:hypothetical protein
MKVPRLLDFWLCIYTYSPQEIDILIYKKKRPAVVHLE